MIDDREGLYASASEALKAGEDFGRHEMYRAVMDILSRVSADYESEKPITKINTAKFHAAQECCKQIRLAWERYNERRDAVRMPTAGSA